MTFNLILMITVLNFAVIVGMLAGIFIINGNANLQKQGFSNEYIKFSRKMILRQTGEWLTAFLIIQIAVGYIVYTILCGLTADNYLNLVFLVSVALIYPFTYWQARKWNPKLREIVLRTKADIVIDFDHGILKLIFNPRFELPFSVAVFLYTTFLLDHSIDFRISPYSIVYFYIIFGWFQYSVLRGYKNLNKPMFRSYYHQAGSFIIFYHIFLALLIFVTTLANIESETFNEWYHYLFFVVLVTALSVKAGYHIRNIAKFRNEIDTLTAA